MLQAVKSGDRVSEAVENGEEEVENDEDDQIVVDQLQYRAPVT